MYSVEYINCKVCGSDRTRLLGIRGNREYVGAVDSGEHMVTNIVRCKECSFVYTNPLIVSKKDGYDNPEHYLSSSSVAPEALFGFTLDLIEKYIDKGRILDIGCGKGEFLSAAKKRGWDAHGLEASPNLARFASEQCNADIISGTLENAKYQDSFFDAVVLNMVLEHIRDPKELLSEIRRILKKEGLLFIEVPNMDSLMLRIATLYFRIKGKDWSPLLSPLHYPFHSYGYNSTSLRYLLYPQDFTIEKVLVRDSNLRGFRQDTGGSRFEKLSRNIITRLAGLIDKGDVLMVVARKRDR